MNRFNSVVPVDEYLGRFLLDIDNCTAIFYYFVSFFRIAASLCVRSFKADSNVLFYLSDAVTQLLEHKEEYAQFGVIRYFAE